MATPHPHSTLGRYELVRVLGRGAMGLVYEARDPNLERRVAIKTIRVDNLSPDAAAEYAARFRTEARSVARLQHPNIVSVYDSDRDGDVAYLVMEFVQGEDLKHHLDAGTRFTLGQALAIADDLLTALDYAHRQAIVHRDVKPANLLIEATGRAKLADFGVARIQDTGESTRTRGSMVGTLKYMSPEQVQGQPVDARSDIFAAGVLLYQLLTGQRPFDADTDFAVIQQIVAQPATPASSLNPMLPPALDAVLERAMAKSRNDRYASAHDFAVALREATPEITDRGVLPAPGRQGAFGTGSGLGTGSGSGTLPRAGSTVPFGPRPIDEAGATVTQELELVYWKDVRDSAEPADLEGFLARFPQGIYADLARRRLRKLSGLGTGTRGSGMFDATLLDGRLPAGANDPGSDTPTTFSGAASWPAAPAPLPTASDDTTAVPVARPAPGSPPGSAPGPAPAHATAPAPTEVASSTASAPSSPSAPARDRRVVMAVAGVAVLAGAVLAFQAMRSDTPQPAAATSLAPAPALPASAASAPAEAASAVSPAVANAASVPTPGTQASSTTAPPPGAGAPVAASSAPRSPASAATVAGSKGAPPRTAASQAPAAGTSTAAQADAPAAPASASPAASRPRPAPASATATASAAGPSASGPAQACSSRVLLSYQICMNEQCALPAYANLPVCLERRAADKANRDTFGGGRN